MFNSRNHTMRFFLSSKWCATRLQGRADPAPTVARPSEGQFFVCGVLRFTICDFSYARLKSSSKFGFNSLNWKILHFGRMTRAPAMRCLGFARHDKKRFWLWDLLFVIFRTLVVRHWRNFMFNSRNHAMRFLHFGRNDINIRYEMSRLRSTWHRCVGTNALVGMRCFDIDFSSFGRRPLVRSAWQRRVGW